MPRPNTDHVLAAQDALSNGLDIALDDIAGSTHIRVSLREFLGCKRNREAFDQFAQVIAEHLQRSQATE